MSKQVSKAGGNDASAGKRIDVLLVERGLFESRARARAAIDAGLVTADDEGDGAVAVPPVDLGAAVDAQQIAVAQHPVARDAVDDLVVDGDARGGREAVVALEVRARPGVGDDGVVRTVGGTQGHQCLDIAPGGQHAGAQPLRMPRDHIEGAEADGAAGSQNGDLLRLTHCTPHPASQSSTANTGMAAVRLSIRSSTPP